MAAIIGRAAVVGALIFGAATAAPQGAAAYAVCLDPDQLCYDAASNYLVYTGTDNPDTGSVWVDGASVYYRSNGPLEPVVGCVVDRVEGNSTIARCDGYRGDTQLTVSLWMGKGADAVTINTPVDGTVYGGDGDDGVIRSEEPGWFPSSLQVFGGAGTDTVNFFNVDSGVRVSLNDTADDGRAGEADNIRGDVEKIVGTSHADTIVGDGSSETIESGHGDDWVQTGGGHDTVVDSGGSDTFLTGTGDDTVRITGSGSADHVHGEDGSDRIDATDGSKTYVHCGEGGTDQDQVDADTVDWVSGDCETVRR